VHLHHELFGVLIMLVAGTLGFAAGTDTPWRDLLALLFGIGAGLVLDEFALLLRLQDVYWSQEGRTSIDAVIVAVILTGMLLVSAAPFGVTAISDAEASARWSAMLIVGGNLCLTVITALKGKPWLALFSVTLPVVGLVGAVRLATPASPWARRRYRRRPGLLDRAADRAARWNRRKQRLITLIGGAPSSTGTSRPR
jgi:lysyl-tRNA synthetase class 2